MKQNMNRDVPTETPKHQTLQYDRIDGTKKNTDTDGLRTLLEHGMQLSAKTGKHTPALILRARARRPPVKSKGAKEQKTYNLYTYLQKTPKSR